MKRLLLIIFFFVLLIVDVNTSEDTLAKDPGTGGVGYIIEVIKRV
ncbi:hypothetical protein [Halobacillus seohaensis]|uniref:Uncharacterized protein n=1 Tax=Halobacillus seohaensis TaxID=447421 RepID=A0ABW2EM42_9BACI